MVIEELGTLGKAKLNKRRSKKKKAIQTKARRARALARLRAVGKAKYIRLIQRLDRLEKVLGLQPLS